MRHAEVFVRFLFLYCMAFAAPVALKTRELVFVDMLVENLPARAQLVLLIVSDVMICVLSAAIFSKTWAYTELGIGQMAPATLLPMYIPYFTMFILFFFLSLFGITNLARHISLLFKS